MSNDDGDDNDGNKKLDDLLDALLGPIDEAFDAKNTTAKADKMYKTDFNKVSMPTETKKDRIIVPIEEYLGIAPKTFDRYFELEGGTFPDLYARYEDKTDDVDSKVQYVATTRGGKLYSNLLVMVVAERQKRAEKELQDKKQRAMKELMDQMLKDFSSSGSFNGSGETTSTRKKY